jgi:ABC-type transport system substrate-binding protein
MVAMWSEVGLNVKMVGMEVGQRVEVSVPDSPYHIITDSSGVLMDIEISQSFHSQRAYYPNMWPAGTFDDIVAVINEGEVTVDQAKRAEIYGKAIDLMNDELPMIVLFTINRIAGIKKGITWSGSPDFGINLRPANFSIA